MAISTAAILGAAAISGGAALYTGGRAADAQKDAAKQAARTQQDQIAQNQGFFETGLELQRPGREVGQQALNSLSVLFGLQPAVPSGVSNQQVIDAQIAREVLPEQAQQAQQQQQFAQTLDAVPADVRAEYERLIDGRVDLPGDDARKRPGFQNRLAEIRRQYPGVADIDRQFSSQGRQIHPDVPAFAPTSAPSSLAQAAGAAPLSSRDANFSQNVDGSPRVVFPGGGGTFNEAAGSEFLDGGTAGAPDLPFAGQDTQLQSTGFFDAPNNAAPTQASVMQSLEDFPVSQFLRDEGMRGIQDSAAARGSLSSGRTLKALSEFNQGFAQSQSVQPFISGLQSLAGVGQNAANSSQNAVNSAQAASSGTSNNLANLALASGDARASAFQNQNDAVQGTIGNLTTAYLLRDQTGGLA